MSTKPATSIGPREKRLLIVLAVVATGSLAFLFLSGGDDEPITLDPPVRPTATATADPGPAGRPPETDQRFEGRDPFEPLVVPVAAGGGAGDGGTNGGTSGGTDGGTNGGTGNGDSGAVDGGGAQTRVVTLLDIFTSDGTRYATVDVDDEQYTVSAGERFAGNFRMLELTRRCATMVYGDERFTLCIGEEVRK